MSKQRTKEEMFAVVEQWESSGLTQQSFCASMGFAVSVFAYWRKKYRDEYQEKEACAFTEIRPDPSSPIEICYPNGIIIRLSEANALTTVKALLNMS